MDQIRLKSSDTILLMGVKNDIERLRHSEETILLDKATTPMKNFRNKAPIALGILFFIIFSATVRWLPISVASIAGVAMLMVTGCIKPSEAYKSVEWNIIILIYGMLSLGLTMEETGVSYYIASSVTSVSLGLLEGSMQMLLALVILYLITSILTELLSNAATIVIMAPISLELAHSLNLCANDAGPFC